jgi:hypothetical protein
MKKTKDKKASDTKNNSTYEYKPGEKKILFKRKKRLEKMLKKKQDLGIDDKCDRMDNLFTPHLTPLDNPSNIKIQTSGQFLNDAVLLERSRKSMPLAFEKITTAISLLIKENPKCVMKASNEEYRERNFLIQGVYYENFATQRKKEVLRKYTYHLGKYGLGYWREYIKKTYRKQHSEEVDEKGNHSIKWVYDIFDVVAENIHPKNVLLDDNCISVKDVNKPANDCGILEYLTNEEFEAVYPVDVYENSAFVKEGQGWMLDINNLKEATVEGKQKIQVITYENKFENLLEVWANEVPIKSVPLPGDELSLQGDKWVEDLDNYDGIGVGQIIEIYLPIIDDIVNASLERLRQIVRPNEDWFNGVDLTDESDDIDYGSGNVRKFTGAKDSIAYSKPPSRTDAEAKEKEEIMDEVDRASMVPRNLAGTDSAKTAYQSAQNRESALQKLSLPLGSIKKTLEDAANLDIPLYQIAYSEPLETSILAPEDDNFDEGLAIIKQAEELGIEDERAVAMEDGTIARRRFREMALPIKVEANNEEGENKPTRIIEADESNFWELTPKHTVWKGTIEIIGESFLPVSKAIDDEQNKETIEYLMNIPITDEMGRPTLTDAQGKPYTIDKVRLAKDRARMNKNFDPEKYVVPLTMENQGQGNLSPDGNPLETPSKISAPEIAGKTRPELNAVKV